MADNQWTRDDAIAFCEMLEDHAPAFGAHIALTGGCLYKDGPRKDVDILVYRIRHVPKIDWDGFFARIASFGVVRGEDHGWCKKARFGDRPVDFLDAEDDGAYGDSDTRINAFVGSFLS